MVIAEQMKIPMNQEAPAFSQESLSSGPSCGPWARLPSGGLHRNDDITQRGHAPVGNRDRRGRERENICGRVVVPIGRVQPADLSITHERQPDFNGLAHRQEQQLTQQGTIGIRSDRDMPLPISDMHKPGERMGVDPARLTLHLRPAVSSDPVSLRTARRRGESPVTTDGAPHPVP